jgi:hypothetical protein
MNCHLCEAEAVTRCYNCGALLCAQHGKDDNCNRCTTAIAAGDPGGNRIAKTPLGPQKKAGWWRPQQAEEHPPPPACYACQGLTRAVCRNCQSPYCYEHKGPNGLCRECGRSARLGMAIFVGIFSFILLFCLYHWLFGRY